MKSNLKKKSREDLLIMLRELTEENEALKQRLAQTQSTQPAQTAEDSAKSDLLFGLEALKNSVDACTKAILGLQKGEAE